MATETYLGELGKLNRIAARNNQWARAANINFMKVGMAMNMSAISMTQPIPDFATPAEEPPEGTTYINPDDQNIHVWTNEWTDGEEDPFPKGWAVFKPTQGLIIFIQDTSRLCIYRESTKLWELLVDLNEEHIATPRELSFYAPGILRQKAVLFCYVPTMEFTIPAGAVGSGAGLDVASSAALTLSLIKNGVAIGTISFAAGSKDGVVSVPNETILHPALPKEGEYTRANTLTVTAPASVGGAQGLNVSLRGMIRAID